jgi:O-Antigen ligase
MGWTGKFAWATSSVLYYVVLGFALLVALDTLFVSPAYTPAGLYPPLLLALAFAVFRRFDDRTERFAVQSVLLVGAIAGIWGLVQAGPMGIARAHAFFETPATYASVMNLLLVPLLACMLAGRRGAWIPISAALFAAALFAADSRGGLIALAAGCGMALVLALRSGQFILRGMAQVAMLLLGTWLVAVAIHALPWARTASTQAEPPIAAQDREASSVSRLELYSVSLDAWREHPIAGTGYLTFRYVLEQGRARVPSYGTSDETWFVHNDYLQMLQELGPLGLAALIALAWLPAWLAYRRIPQLPEASKTVVVACAAGATAMACHALVDYPFYLPACLLLYGALLGALDRRIRASSAEGAGPQAAGPLRRSGGAVLAVLVAIVLIRPLAAGAAAEWGLREQAAGDARAAAFWLSTAPVIDSGDWRFHWYAGQFWEVQAAVSGRREAARLAATAYAAGFDANPLEVKNLLGKISVQMHHHDLLDAPASAATVKEWVAKAHGLAPYNAEVRRAAALVRGIS